MAMRRERRLKKALKRVAAETGLNELLCEMRLPSAVLVCHEQVGPGVRDGKTRSCVLSTAMRL
jgi:hypothetical protein